MKAPFKAGIRLFSDSSGQRELLGFADGSFFEVVSPATPKARESIKTAVLRAYKSAARRAG